MLAVKINTLVDALNVTGLGFNFGETQRDFCFELNKESSIDLESFTPGGGGGSLSASPEARHSRRGSFPHEFG